MGTALSPADFCSGDCECLACRCANSLQLVSTRQLETYRRSRAAAGSQRNAVEDSREIYFSYGFHGMHFCREQRVIFSLHIASIKRHLRTS